VRLLALCALQAVVLCVAAARNTQQLNTDAIAYLRIAGYWANWQSDLMVSGYWGPLLSWLIAPLLKLGMEPLPAARSVMALSALAFSFGSFRLLGALGLPNALRLAGTGVVALASVYWSVELISPDLLLAGLLCLAIGELVSDAWPATHRAAIHCGVWWGLAYLAKPVAFPLAFGVTLAMAVLHAVGRTAKLRRIGRSAGMTLGVFALLAAPWVTALSVKYGGFTFSTSGRINHAIVGPGNADNIGRYHPFVREFHAPDAGRVTMWEDPSRMKYPYWSPFESAAHMRHQVHLVQRNAVSVGQILAGLDWFHLGLLSLLGCCFLRPPWRESLARERWCWVLAPLACLGGVYLPVYVQPVDERYFYAALPLLLAAALSVAVSLTRKAAEQAPWAKWLAAGFVCVSFGLLPCFRALAATDGLRHEGGRVARVLAEKLRRANLVGPVAGSGMDQATDFQRAGLYAAFFLGVPWHGDEVRPAPERFLQSGARLVVVARGEAENPGPLARALAEHPDFRNLDAALFASPEEAKEFPLAVFEIRQSK